MPRRYYVRILPETEHITNYLLFHFRYFVGMATSKPDCQSDKNATVDDAEIVPVRERVSIDGQVRLSKEFFNFTAEAESLLDAYK